MNEDSLNGLVERLDKYEICGVGMTVEEGQAANCDLKLAVRILKGLQAVQGDSEKLCPYLAQVNAHGCGECPAGLNEELKFCPFSVDSYIRSSK